MTNICREFIWLIYFDPLSKLALTNEMKKLKPPNGKPFIFISTYFFPIELLHSYNFEFRISKIIYIELTIYLSFCKFANQNLFFWKWESLFQFFGEGNGTPLQYSCRENPMDGGVW